MDLKWLKDFVVLSFLIFLLNSCTTGSSGDSSDATTDTVSGSDVKVITSFLIEASKNIDFSSDIIGTVNNAEKTVQLLIPWNNAVNNLIPSIEFDGISIDPASGTITDFTNPMTYIVTAENGSTQNYVVTADFCVPFNTASGISFTDTDQDGGQLGGDVTIFKADNESDITGYALYWGSDAITKLSLIQTYLKTGSNLAHTFGNDTVIPEGATHLLVFTWNDIGEMQTAVSTIFSDALSWAKSFDSAGSLDHANSVQQTTDKGYIVAGFTYVYGVGGPDGWILKLDGSGNISWEKKFGDPGNNQNDAINAIQQTAAGGYIAAGYTGLNGGKDMWVLNLDATGDILWQKTYGELDSSRITGSSVFETAQSIKQTDDDQDGDADDGFIVAGYTYDFPPSTGAYKKMWLIKLDVMGGISWQKTFGGATYSDNDRAYSVQQTSDGGYIVAGQTGINNLNIRLHKLDSSGDVVWQKSYGGSGTEYAFSVQQAAEGGYIVAGTTYSFGAVNGDVWILKLDAVGAVEWEKALGDSGTTEWGKSIRQTDDDADGNADDGFIVAGHKRDPSATGSADIWILKLDASGDITWQKTFGGTTGDDYSDSIFQTADGGYIIAGRTNSFDTAFGDLWLLKIASDSSLATVECGFGGDLIIVNNTTVDSSNSSAVVADTFQSGVVTNITGVSTNITGTDTLATVSNQCY